MSLVLYSIGWWLVSPLAMLYLLWRSRRQPEYRRHWAERWGVVRARSGRTPLVWVHAVSVGETRAAQPLVDALLARDPALRVLLTHMTPTGRQTGTDLFGKRWGERVVQAYLPYDLGYATRRFFAAWRPTMGIVLETELWPNLCAAAKRAGVPVAFVNVRLSEKSLRSGLRWRGLMQPAVASLACVVAQTEDDAQRVSLLGRSDVIVAGNLKFDVSAPAEMIERGRAWRAAFGDRAVVLAASTRDGEEALLLDAWRARRGDARTLLLLVPRHPQRFGEVEALVHARGLRVARRSAVLGDGAAGAEPPTRIGEVDVLLGDSMGEMFAYYGASDVAIIGGALLPFGGQNLIEACAAGVPVVLGPHTYNFAQAAEQAVAAGAATRVADADEAVQVALALVGNPPECERMSVAAEAFARRHRGATARTMAAIERFLPR